MKTIIKSIILTIGLSAVFYSAISFYLLETNPLKWGQGERLLFLLFLVLWIVISWMYYDYVKNKNK